MNLMKKYLYSMIQKCRIKQFEKAGKDITVNKNCTFFGHIEVGNHVKIGQGAYFVSSRAKLIIGNNVLFGPNVTIYTGDHPIHVVGKHLIDVTDTDKDRIGGEFDKDVFIEEGCWIGTRAIILKGVTVGQGSIIGAGAVVTKDVPPYSVYIGVPQQRVFPRFTSAEIEKHEHILRQ
jgi:acetyltransferase-like isoleucine patch superfamily enzyme